MNDEFSIEVKSIELEYDPAPQDTMPTWAIIELTINGMPATFCPSIRPDDEGRLRLYPRDPGQMQFAWGSDDAWEDEVYSALAEHMHADWDEDDFWDVTEAVNQAVYAACNAELKDKDIDWQDEYKLDTAEQRRAAEILAGPWHVCLNSMQISVDHGYAVITRHHSTISRTPITRDLARRVVEAGSDIGGPSYHDAGRLADMIDAIEND